MADYYPLLTRAIATLPDRDPARRHAIYQRAREALERQLRSLDPPLGEEEILSETLALDDVILRIEADFTALPSQSILAEASAERSGPSVEGPANAARLSGVAEGDEAAMGLQPPRSRGPERPRIASREETEKGRRKLGFWAVAGGVAIAVMGTFAYLKKEDLAHFGQGGIRPMEAPQSNESDAAKREGRLSSAPSETPPARVPQTPPANPPPATGGSASSPVEARPPAPVASRAFMVLETQGTAPSQFEGVANWSFAVDPASRSGEKILRVQVEYAAAGLSIDMILSRNTDKTIPASHTFFVTFNPRNAMPPVREMSPIEWRELESQTGPTLAGPLVPIQDNVFLMGLDNSEAAIQRNLNLLRFQRWMVFDVRLATGRRAAFLIEKGPPGERAVNEALATWK
ncbi:MAG: hypothetical protein O9306_02925 [Beijerinckiaceae bacterium]|nr:hypothetical protein [Beijerinckiaceae bacterium]